MKNCEHCKRDIYENADMTGEELEAGQLHVDDCIPVDGGEFVCSDECEAAYEAEGHALFAEDCDSYDSIRATNFKA